MTTDAQAKKALEMSKSVIGNPLIYVGGPRTINPRDVLETGKQVRDRIIHQLPILPGAVQIFVQIASSRSWSVSGRPRGVARAVEWVNGAETYDPYTGMKYTGYQQYLARKALDSLTIGRTSFLVRSSSSNSSPLEYVDPAHLKFQREKVNAKRGDAVRDDEKVWVYHNGASFKNKEIFLDHPMPISNSMFISPIAFLLPSAHLAWLLREHHTTQLDGRKIRDIIMVHNNMAEGIKTAIAQQAALYSGANPSQVGIPVVNVTMSGNNPIDNYFATLGLSNISDKFDEAQFLRSYTNQIASGLGLSLRQFWNDESTTNRALEDIQEQRQQQKGPAYFIRSEQRLMNNSGVLERFGTGVNRVRFGFVEETDLSTKLNNAQVLRESAEALKSIGEVFGDTITPQSYLAWMQNLGVLPYEVEITEGASETTILSGEHDAMNTEDELTTSGDVEPSAFDPKSISKRLKYDEITMNQDGQVIEKRLKIFSVLKLLADEMYVEQLREKKPQTDEEAYALALDVASLENQDEFRRMWEYNSEDIDDFVKMSILVDTKQAMSAIGKCVEHEPLSERDQEIIDTLISVLAGED